MAATDGVIADRGRLVVVCGPMWSGKTERLLELLDEGERAGLPVVAIRPHLDSRHEEPVLASHAGRSRPARFARSAADVRAFASGAGLVVLDEAQFVAGDVVSVLLELRAAGASVVAAGLDRDFRGLPFGPMPRLAAAADRVELLAATCARCGGRAAYSQRLVAGRPAPWEDATIRVGARELYEPRCARCFERPRRAASA